MWRLVLVLAGGCGRLGFDATGDAGPGGHDEDGDGIADVIDRCPHLAGDQADGDGDRVGDACDPEPMIPRQTLAVFDAMLDASGFIVQSADWQPVGDALRVDASMVYGELRRSIAVDEVAIEIGVDIVAAPPAAQYQVAVAAFDGTPASYYYGEVYAAPAPVGYAAISFYDGATFLPIEDTTLPTGIHPGPFALRWSVIGASRTGTLQTGWPGEPYTLTTALPGYAPRANIGVGVQGLVVELRYFVVITSS